jgi:hypothetical protein
MKWYTHTALALSLFPHLAYATKLGPPTASLGGTLQDFIYLLINIIQAVGIPILVICIIYSGYLLVSAGGNEQQVTKAKSWIIWTLVGAAIILGAEVIANLIFTTAEEFE